MTLTRKDAIACLLLLAFAAMGCRFFQGTTANQAPAANADAPRTSSSRESNSADGSGDSGDTGDFVTSETGVEKEKPAAGKANVQGKVLYNGQPVDSIEVKLCETFNQYFGGCSGETFTAKTDANGEYLIKNVPPGIYEGLVAKVFKTDYYVFATTGFIGSAKYQLDADKTFFARDTNLFKNDLKLVSPRSGSKVPAGSIEVKWEAYPDAAYYKVSVNGDTSTGAETDLDFINKRVDGLSFVIDKPLKPGSYNPRVTAYNAGDVKLSDSSDDIKFTVTGGTAK